LGALDGFESTWSNARSTFGQGTPQEGAQFDNSGQLRQMQSTVESAKPGDRWTGSGSDTYATANEKQSRALGQLADLDQRLRTEVDRSAQVVNAGRQNLDAVRQWVHDAAATVPPGQNRDRMLYPIVSRGAGEIADIVQRSNGDLSAIAERVRRLGGEYQMLGDPKQGDGEKPDGVIGDKSEEEKRRAREDVDAALRGDKDAQARVRQVQNTIDQNQLAGNAKLNSEQASYLSQMQAQQKLRTVEQLDEAAKKGASDIMADSWQLMSNPNLEFPKTESRDGALEDPTNVVRGGFDQLPDSVRSTLESPGIQQHENLQKIADITNTGNDHFQKNTDFDRGMMHKVADMMESPEWRAGDPAFDNPLDLPMPWEPDEVPPHADLERAATTAMEAVSPDHQVVHDAITGDVQPGNEYGEKFRINSENFTYNLTHEEWDDDGAAAGSLFDWTAVPPDSPEAKIAAETASSYSKYIGEHRADLLQLDGNSVVGLDGKHTLGEVNPLLVLAMSDGLVPYVDDMGGMGDSPFFPAIDGVTDRDAGLMPNAKGVFAVLNSDAEAATAINSAAYQEALKHETAFAMNPGDPGAGGHLHASATMRGLVDVGTHEMFQARALNEHAMDVSEHEWKKSGYSAGVTALSTAGEMMIPGVGPVAGNVIEQVGAALEGQILGETPSPPVEHGLPAMATTRSAEYVLNAMLAAGQPLDLPRGFIDFSDPAYPQGKVVHPTGLDDWAYYNVLKAEVGQHIAPVTDGIGPLETFEKRYNNVAQDPDVKPPAG
jgi:uncharacterized protein YukE